MNRADLHALAERVEALTGPDRAVDAEIAIAVNHRVYPGLSAMDIVRLSGAKDAAAFLAELADNPQNVWYEGLPRYTASIDAAMKLVPDGWDWKLESYGHAVIWRRGHEDGAYFYADVPNFPALALTAVALRAHAEGASE